jgi:hypothetical protein
MFEDLIPELQQPARELVDACGQAGLQPRVTSTRRTHAAQARLYRRWQQGISPFPAAPPGGSEHEFGYAFDLVVTPFEALGDVGYTWQSWGGVWPGAVDPVHFAYPGFVPPSLESSPEPSAFATFLDRYILTVGPWFASISASTILKKGVAIEKALGFDAAIDWFWRHVAVNPDKP